MVSHKDDLKTGIFMISNPYKILHINRYVILANLC